MLLLAVRSGLLGNTAVEGIKVMVRSPDGVSDGAINRGSQRRICENEARVGECGCVYAFAEYRSNFRVD
jgi:hypothetical protein